MDRVQELNDLKTSYDQLQAESDALKAQFDQLQERMTTVKADLESSSLDLANAKKELAASAEWLSNRKWHSTRLICEPSGCRASSWTTRACWRLRKLSAACGATWSP